MSYFYAPMGILLNTYKSWGLLIDILLAKTKAEQYAAATEVEQKSCARKIKLFTFLNSKVFGFLLAAGSILIHTALYFGAIFGGSFGPYCELWGWVYYYSIVIAIFFIVLYIFFYFLSSLYMLFGRLRDTWSIRFELIFIPLYWVPLIVAFSICWFLNDKWPERYMPATFWLWIAGYIDVIICSFVPIIRTFIVRNKIITFKSLLRSNLTSEDDYMDIRKSQEITQSLIKDESLSALHETLNSGMLRAEFLKFTTASLCPESLLFWQDVKQKYEKTEDHTERCALAQQILDQYIVAGSPNELNLNSKQRTILARVTQNAIQEACATNAMLPDELFAVYLVQVEADLCDSFARFVLTKEYKKVALNSRSKFSLLNFFK